MISETKLEEGVANLKIDDTQEKKIISLEILKIIKDSQQQHGLRHSDYQRYRGYCTRRIRRLRKALHLVQGDKRHYKRKDVTESHLTDERYLYIPLMLSERAWSYAMQLRQEANTEPRKFFHMKSRLRKAASVHALQLQALCQSELCDARSKLEAEGYVAWIQGSLLFELQDWQKAMERLQQAQMVYLKLTEAVGEEEAALYRNRVEEIQPSLRYCAYNVGDQSAISDLQNMRTSLGQDSLILDKLDALMEEARGKLKGVEEVEWRGRRITVKPESVGTFLAAEQALDKTSADIDTLERHLAKCRDAIAAVRDSMSEQGGGGKTKQGGGIGPGGGQLLLTYLTHIRLSRTIQRILLIIEKTKEQESEVKEGKKPKGQDLIRLYEMILQNLCEMQQLQGLENDKGYQETVEDDINLYKAHRCFYMSEVLSSSKHYKEAYAILERALNYVSKVHGERAKPLKSQIELSKNNALAQTAFQMSSPQPGTSIDEKKVHKSSVPLIDRLDEYVEEPTVTGANPNLVHFPPEMQPVAYKPLFFDIAVNHLALPKLDDKPAKQQQQQGISSFVKGLWGGWSK